MDVLVSLGTNAAYIYSVISVLHRRSLHQQGIDVDNMGFFETSALLITFISLGKYLEAHAKGKTSQVRAHVLHQKVALCLGMSAYIMAACLCKVQNRERKPLQCIPSNGLIRHAQYWWQDSQTFFNMLASVTCVRLQAVTELLKLTPSTATLVARDETGRVVSEEEVPTALIQRGDLLKVSSFIPPSNWTSSVFMYIQCSVRLSSLSVADPPSRHRVFHCFAMLQCAHFALGMKEAVSRGNVRLS